MAISLASFLSPRGVPISILQRLGRIAHGDVAARWNTNRDAWGRAGTMTPPWREGEARIITSIDPPVVWRTPQQQTLLLRAQLVPHPTIFQSGVIRWEVQAGVGNASVVYRFDATALQQVSLPAEALRVSLVAEAWGLTPFDFGYTSVHFGVLIGDGMTSTGAARFTQLVDADVAATQTDVPVPNGATGFRVGGSPHNLAPGNPFLADKSYTFRQAGGSFEDSFNGEDMLIVHTTDNFIPLSGTVDLLRITHPVGDFTGLIVWQLEL